MQIGFVNSSKHWVSRQPQLRLRLLRLAPIFRLDGWRLCNRLPYIPGAWRLPRERREKPDVSQRESAPPEQPSRLQEIVPPPVPPPAAPAFEVHEALPVELQQPPIIKTPVEAYAAPKAFGVAKRLISR